MTCIPDINRTTVQPVSGWYTFRWPRWYIFRWPAAPTARQSSGASHASNAKVSGARNRQSDTPSHAHPYTLGAMGMPLTKFTSLFCGSIFVNLRFARITSLPL